MKLDEEVSNWVTNVKQTLALFAWRYVVNLVIYKNRNRWLIIKIQSLLIVISQAIRKVVIYYLI